MAPFRNLLPITQSIERFSNPIVRGVKLSSDGSDLPSLTIAHQLANPALQGSLVLGASYRCTVMRFHDYLGFLKARPTNERKVD